jgi:hypothetical protein
MTEKFDFDHNSTATENYERGTALVRSRVRRQPRNGCSPSARSSRRARPHPGGWSWWRNRVVSYSRVNARAGNSPQSILPPRCFVKQGSGLRTLGRWTGLRGSRKRTKSE